MNFGIAPYKIVNCYIAREGCAHCGQLIVNVYLVQDGEGKTYPVGSGCVKHIWGKEIKGFREADRKLKQLLEEKKIAQNEEAYNHALIKLAALPHPTPYFADQGKTAADYFNFCRKSSVNMRKAIAYAGAIV